MPAKLSPQERLKLLKQVLSGESVSVVCRKAGISRTLLYRWLKRFEQHKKIATLAPKKPKIVSNGHVSQDNLKAIIAVVKANPMLSVARIVAKLPKDAKEKPLVGHHGVQNVLARFNLNTIKKRKAFQKASFDRPVSVPVQAMPVGMQAEAIGLPNRALRPQDRLTMIRRVQAGEPVSKVCEEYGISRTIFYRWLKRYEEAMEGQRLEALWDKKPKVEKYFNQAPKQYEDAVLSAIAQYPELSTHKLVEVLPHVGGKPILGNHGVQNVLQRYNLNTYEKRLTYSKSQAHARGFEPGVGALERIIAYLLGQTPAFRTFLVRASFTLAFSVFVGVTIYGAAALLRIFTAAPSITFSIGMLFSLVALICGMFFFIYSLKYYFTIAVVLSFSRRGEEGEKEKDASLLHALFGYSQASHIQPSREEVERGGGLLTDISHILLSRKPFISIQLATYNEKRVVDRLLTAATAMDYENYEVIIVDDSTDETVAILNKWKDHPRVKVIHRSSREGFKGGALRDAIRASSPQTEFVLIFDADFIPYPDTITHFLKYFQHLANGLSPSALSQSNIAAVQGYQWHVLNKSENWITRGIRSEYAGSYVIERSGAEIYGGIKQIAGSVYMIRADALKKVGFGTSITEDFELTLKLYEQGYKVAYTPYIQAPAEAVATIKRLIRQRMRWAEGHSNNIKRMFFRLLRSPKLTLTEKLELVYLSPYYLQAFFFMIGTASWFIAEVILRVTLPFWAEVWGWSLVFTNMLALPLMNMVGLFLEESEEKDYLGLLSFVALSYIVAPFQAYAAVRGFVGNEGPWFRTPKTGRITDTFTPGKFYRYLSGFFGQAAPAVAHANSDQLGSTIRSNSYVALATAHNRFSSFRIRPKKARWLAKLLLTITLIFSITIYHMSYKISEVYATNPSGTFAIDSAASANMNTSWQLKDNTWSTVNSNTKTTPAKNSGTFQYIPGSNNTSAGTPDTNTPTGKGWIFDTNFGLGDGLGSIADGNWVFNLCTTDSDTDNRGGGYPRYLAWKVSLTGTAPNQTISTSTNLFDTTSSCSGTNLWTGGTNTNRSCTVNPTGTTYTFNSNENYLLLEIWDEVNDANDDNGDNETFIAGNGSCSTDPRITTPAVTIPEFAVVLIFVVPFIPVVVKMLRQKRRRLALSAYPRMARNT